MRASDPTAPQVVTDVRRRMADLLRAAGAPADFVPTEQELRHLLHLRAVGFGEVTVTVVKGQPARVVRVEAALDYTKPIAFE